MDVGVIGTGTMGQNHVRVYSELKAVDELIIYDLNSSAAQEIAQKNDAIVAKSLEELLRSVDAASICVPTKFHFDIASQTAAAGVHMLIEKPMCMTAQEAETLNQMISPDLTVGIGHIERFNPIIPEIARIVNNPLYVEMKRHNPASARVTGSTIVEDLMIHDIDIIANCLFSGSYTLSCTGNPDICAVLFHFDGTPVYLSASRKSSKKIRMIYIEEEDCTIEGDFMTQEIFVHRKPGQYSMTDDRYVQENIIEKVLVNKVEPLKVELATFLDCIKTGAEFPVPPNQAIRNLRICEEIKGICAL
jgi:predicted dehydrogenase